MKKFREFYKEELGTLRAICEDGVIWFDFHDVGMALGLSGEQPRAVFAFVDEEDKKIIDVPCDWEDRTDHVLCVNKCGLYTMLLAVNFPEERNVEEIKKWVAKEIVPAMREAENV